MPTHPTERTLAAPETLGLPTRLAFREQAVALLDAMPQGGGRLVVDLSRTRKVDSSGLSALVLVQRRAEESAAAVVLRGVRDELRFLIALSRLSGLFVFEE